MFFEEGVMTPLNTEMGVYITHLIQSNRTDRQDVLQDAAHCGTLLAGPRGVGFCFPLFLSQFSFMCF
jgi:hypothetical protein